MEHLDRTLRLVKVAAVLAAVCCIGSPAAAEESKWTCDRRPLLIRGGWIWTGERLAKDADLLVVDGHIRAIAEAGKIEAPPKARVIDASGSTLIPGLIDSHAHFFELGGPMSVELEGDPFEQTFRVIGRQLLASGVTSARAHLFDLELGPELARRSQDDCYAVPRLQIGGPGFIGGAPELSARQVWGVSGQEDARAKIARIRATGAQWIALHNLADFAGGEAEAIVAEARERGLGVMASGRSATDAEIALDLAVDSIEYLDLTAEPAYPPELITSITEAADPPTFVPPIGYYYRLMHYRRNPDSVALGPLAELLPEEFAANLIDGLRQTLETDSYIQEVLTALPTLGTKFEQLRSSKAPLAVGSDCGSPGHFHQDSIWWELSTWRSLRVPMEKTLAAATTSGADLLGEESIGRLAVGKRADIVVFDGNILQDPPAVERVRAVIKGGVVFVDRHVWVGPP